MKRWAVGFAVLVVLALVAGTAQAVEIETVPVGNPRNTGEWSGESHGGFGPDRICGAVDYAYSIGKYEVTAGQYVEFLNAVDPDGDNSEGLYNSRMEREGILSLGCQITWNSETTSYDFSGGTAEAPGSTAADWENRPVNCVSWYDAAMFANWLTSGDINTGAYDTSVGAGWGDSYAGNYTGITPHDSAEMDALVSTYGKVWVIPTEDEWYKAAYHKNDGVTGNYFDYPTSSDTVPGYVDNDGELSGTSTAFIDGVADPGNYATYDGAGGTEGIGSPYYRTEVGEWENSDSPYGTFDQGGNVFEWNEEVLAIPPVPPSPLDGSGRGTRGGSFSEYHGALPASLRIAHHPWADAMGIGFRVGSIPEPGSITLLVCGTLALLTYAWRRRRGG